MKYLLPIALLLTACDDCVPPKCLGPGETMTVPLHELVEPSGCTWEELEPGDWHCVHRQEAR